ncbi:nuclear transport factor 2 family protein [Frondihabitans peucedani]|uniref:SnoaL-like domain-containing protein n=1 Tax=Frondihabitans peucedani TaxID=598626 RepID=A0ABP8E6L8_9MICO
MATISELLDTNLHEVFAERDGSVRRAVVDRTYTDDVSFADPEEIVTGRAALDAKAAALLGGAPETFVFASDGPKYVGEGIGALPWAFGPAGAPILHGIDVITVRDGLIATVATFFREGDQP